MIKAAFSRLKALPIASAASIIWLVALAFHYIDVGSNAIARPPASDFYKFYISAQRVDAGFSMYWMVPTRQKKGDPCHPDTPEEEATKKLDDKPSRLNVGGDLPCLGPNLNPPVFTAAMLPLSRLPYREAWWFWGAFSSLCTVAFAILIACDIGKTLVNRLFYVPVTCALTFTFYPTLANYALGQLGSLISVLLLLSWRNAKMGRDIKAGAYLGMALAIKPIFGLLWLCILAVRSWAFAGWGVVFAAFLTAIGAAIFGISAYSDYAQVAGNVHWAATNWNASWFGLFERAFSVQIDSNWMTDHVVSKFLGALFSCATLVVSAQALQRHKYASHSQLMCAVFAIGLPATLLASPLGWMYYFPVFIISIYCLIQWVRSEGLSGYRLPLALIVVVTMVPVGLKPTPSPGNPTAWYGLDSWYWLCAFLLWAVTTHALTAGRPAEQKRRGA